MKKIIQGLLAALLLFTLTGCSTLQGLQGILNGDAAVARAQSGEYIWFSKDDTLGNADDLFLTVEEARALPLAYRGYHSTLHYNTLSANEQTLYGALAYALEQGYILVVVDQALQLQEQQAGDVLVDFSLDSPLVEQNLWYAVGQCSMQYPVTVLGVLRRQATFNGIYVRVDNFADEWWAKKQQAIAAAEGVVAQMPQGQSQAQKAQWLYRYLVEHTEYDDYGGVDIEQIQPYVYDALVTGKTHCDGLTNGLGLLLHLAGIPSAEKIYFADQGEAVGHTWNIFQVDGLWYNADATAKEAVTKASAGMGAGLFFGYSDLFQEQIPYRAERYPVCEKGLYLQPDAHISNLSNEAFLQAVQQGFNVHKDYALVVVDGYNATQIKAQVQRLANRWGRTVHWITYDLAGARTAVLVYTGDPFEN